MVRTFVYFNYQTYAKFHCDAQIKVEVIFLLGRHSVLAAADTLSALTARVFFFFSRRTLLVQVLSFVFFFAISDFSAFKQNHVITFAIRSSREAYRREGIKRARADLC